MNNFFHQIGSRYTLIHNGSSYSIDVNNPNAEVPRIQVFLELLTNYSSDNDLQPIIDFFTEVENKVLNEDSYLSDLVKIDNGYALQEFPTLILPRIFVDAWKNADEEYKVALRNFWGWCINLDADTRADLFPFIKRNGITITPNGQFIGYRGVVNVDGVDNDLLEFVTTSYLETKSKKKSPAKTSVYQNTEDGSYFLFEHRRKTQPEVPYSDLGTIADLHDSLGESEQHFTDKYTGKMKIVIGKPVTKPREECDHNSTNECSSGLHVTSWGSLGSWYSWNGNNGNASRLAVLVNPMDVVAVPEKYQGTKLRCCRYLPIATIEDKPVNEIMGSDLVDYDNQHLIGTVENLNELLEALDLDTIEHKLDMKDEDISVINLLSQVTSSKIRDHFTTISETHGSSSFGNDYDDYEEDDWDDEDEYEEDYY